MKYFSAIFLLCVSLTHLSAQSRGEATSTTGGQDDTLVFQTVPESDASLEGKNIFVLLSDTKSGSGSVSINQPSSLKTALSKHITSNASREVTCYRVRIYFDNSQNARNKSLAIARAFTAKYPSIPVYRNHVNPYFKVTVGNFRTRDEAQHFADEIASSYNSVFLVKEKVRYPSL